MPNMKQVLIAVDQLLNTLTGGWADETVSARAWRCNSIWAVRFINWIFGNPNHCKDSYESELYMRQLPRSYHIHEDTQ